MKSIKRILTVVIVAVVAIAAATPAAAQFRFGIKAGAAINDLKFDGELLNKEENRAGFTGGVMTEFTVPLIGVGVDASVLYVHRTIDVKGADASGINDGRDYIDIPINLKYKLTLPGVSYVVKPFVTTGPSFAFLVSKKKVNEFLENKSCDISWNFGFGVELFSKVQVAASYGIGLTKALEFTGQSNNGYSIEGKNRYWTVTAAYLF